MNTLEKNKNQTEILKIIMQDSELKKKGKFISQTVIKILKNVGKYSKYILSVNEEFLFYKEIQPILEK